MNIFIKQFLSISIGSDGDRVRFSPSVELVAITGSKSSID